MTMPPKRKASSSHLEESPAKRSTRSSARTESTETPSRTTRTSGKIKTNDPPSTPVKTPKPTRTYGTGSRRRRDNPTSDSLKENDGKGGGNDGAKGSDDELDLLSPSKTQSALSLRERTPKKSRGKVLQSPRKPTKHTERQKPPSQGGGLLDEAGAYMEIFTEGRSTHSRKPPSSKQTVSKPLVTNEINNFDLPDVLSSDMSVSLEPELDLNQKRISLKTEKRRNTRQNTSSTQAPAFDGVVISTPTKQKLLKNAPLPQPPSRDPSCIPQSVDPRLVLDSVLPESPAPEFRHLSVPQTPTSLPIIPNALPIHFHSYLDAQKKAILQALQQPPEVISENKEDEMLSTNRVSAEQLTGLLSGTIHRGEGNSCLVLGPRGSGKSRLVQQCIDDFSTSKPIVLRLSGWTQHSDRLAMREIAYQLRQQVDTLVLPQGADALNADEAEEDDEARLIPDNIISTKLPPAAQLPALISLLPTLDRPTIVIVDGFDLYTLHPRQALLYCLFDTVQSCQALPGTKGIAVIGVTSRIDTLVLLEKRVKSRFSGRMIRTAPPHTVEGWEVLARAILTPRIEEFLTGESAGTDLIVEWYGLWTAIVEQFMQDRAVQNLWNEAFSVTRDVRMLTRALLSTVLRLSSSSFCLSSAHLMSASMVQRVRPRFPLLHSLPYPAVCLLIASVHADTAGQSTFTFEMLHECFRDQVRASTSAPVQVKGGSIGMVRCSRQVLMGTFEDLVAMRVFVPVAAYAQSTAKEFVKYRSVIEREDVKKAVEKMGQVNLKKWLTKATQ